MTKGIILTDSHGNWIGVSESFMKHQVSSNRNMFWADSPEQVYHQGDWTDLAFWPATNGVYNPETGEDEFSPWTWKEGDVWVYRHFYHNLALPWQTPMYGFTSAQKGDNDVDARVAPWVDLDQYNIPLYDI